MITKFVKYKFDIVSNQNRTYPKGLACEVAKTNIFFKIKDSDLSKIIKNIYLIIFIETLKKYKIFNFSK